MAVTLTVTQGPAQGKIWSFTEHDTFLFGRMPDGHANFPEDTLNAQTLARDFNDDEAVWRAFADRRQLRKWLGSPLPLTDEAADALDWLWAERHARPVRAIGFPLP